MGGVDNSVRRTYISTSHWNCNGETLFFSGSRFAFANVSVFFLTAKSCRKALN